MAENTPDQKSAARRGHPEGALGGLVKAERLMQIAVALPVSVLVGWGLGVLLDKWLHQHWIYIPGLLVGCIAGFIEVFHIVQRNEKDMQ